jgi:hypothetical protein
MEHVITDAETGKVTKIPFTAEEEAAFRNRVASIPYTEKRIAEYPSIGDQLDALFHAGVFPPEMSARIQAVKDKYPK